MTITHDELVEMMTAEKEEIAKHKWIESEKVGYDLGIYACLDWIHRFAAKWREEYEKRKNSK